MLRTLKMEKFIVLKQKSTYIILLIAMCFITFFTIMMYYSNTGDITSQSDISISNLENKVEKSPNNFTKFCEEIICSDVIIMFVTIFSVILAHLEYRNDYLKSIWNVISPYNLIVSKCVILAYFIILLYVCTFAMIGALNIVFLHAELGPLSDLLVILFFQFLMELAFGSLIIMISFLIKNTIAAIISCIVYVSFAHIILKNTINIIINKGLKLCSSFNIDKYTLYGNILNTKSNASDTHIILASALSVVVLGLSIFLSGIFLRKKYE